LRLDEEGNASGKPQKSEDDHPTDETEFEGALNQSIAQAPRLTAEYFGPDMGMFWRVAARANLIGTKAAAHHAAHG
jgi:hypothetical protein